MSKASTVVAEAELSLTAFFVLLNRSRFESEVLPSISDVLAGRAEEALRILKSRRAVVAASMDTPPLNFFRHVVDLAIDTLEGRLTTAFVNELTPLITEQAEAFVHNVNTHVRGGLALSLCAERPSPDCSPVFQFRLRPSALIGEWSPTANNVADLDDFVERVQVGIFGEPEAFVQRACLKQIASDIQTLIDVLPSLAEEEHAFQAVEHFRALVSAPLENSELGLLRGYL